MKNEHVQCHNLVCNAHFQHPRYAKNVGCSCRERENRLHAELATLKAQNAILENKSEYLASEVSVLRKVLKECRTKWDKTDNGSCAVCRCGHRLYDLKGNVQQCENPECLSHRIREALEHGDPCDLCGKEMNDTDTQARFENAVLGAHRKCVEAIAEVDGLEGK